MKRSLLILFFCLFIVMVGYGLILPVLPFFIERLALSKDATSAEASFQVGALTGIFALMQFFCAPIWGKWSDQLGRRPLFLMGLCGFSFSMVLFGLGTNLMMLYTARIIGGVLSAALLPTANAYVTDITSQKERGRGMAWLGSAVGLGIVVGPALGAFLSRRDLHLTYRFWHFAIDGFSVPFFGGALLSILAIIGAILWLPEPNKQPLGELPIEQTRREDVPKLNSTGRFIPGWLRPFLVLALLTQFGLSAFEGTFAIHAKEVMQFGISEMGWVFLVCGFVMSAAQGTVVSRLIERLGERPLLPPGFALMGVGLAMLMTTRSMSFILLYVALFAFGVALINPSLSSLVSKGAGNRPGAVLGQLTAANSLGLAGGPVIAGLLLAWDVHAPYLLTALLLAATASYTAMATLRRPD